MFPVNNCAAQCAPTSEDSGQVRVGEKSHERQPLLGRGQYAPV